MYLLRYENRQKNEQHHSTPGYQAAGHNHLGSPVVWGKGGKVTINLFQPSLSTEELTAVAHTFDTNWPGKGPKVAEFEAAWAAHINADPANVVSVNSCTEGLFTAVKLLDIGPGDEVIIPTIHFVGAAQAVLSAGAKPVFCDVDSRTLNTTMEFINDKLTPKTRAVILNHYGGVPCDMDNITSLGTPMGWPHIWLIEDAANAPASTFNGQAIGTFGDIGVWSFDAMKIISTGDGGMMWFRDRELADKARKQLYLGTSEGSGLSSDKARWWEFEVEIEGARRSVMNDLAASVGLEQLKKLAGFVEKRLEIVAKYQDLLKEYVTVPHNPGYYFYWIQTPKRDELARYLRDKGIYVTFRYYPLHRAYDLSDHLPNAEKAADTTLLLPLHQSLTNEEVEFISNAVIEFYK